MESFTDDELAELALSADPDTPIPDDAVPFGPTGTGLLPEWYMPAPVSGRRTRGRVVAAAVIVGSLVLVSAAGFCVTSGFPEIAW